jgi:flagellar biosynthesis protein FlhG
MDQAENLRNVIKLQNQNYKPNARVITVTSGKGGVGKSNLAVNLAIQMHKMGKKVLIFDADFGLANVEVMFGAIPQYNLSDMIYHGMNIKEIITEGPEGVDFVSAGTGIIGFNDLSKEQIMYLVKSLRELDQLADVILIDTGAGIAPSVLDFVMASPEVLVVATPDPSSLTDSYSLLKTLYRNPDFKREQTEIYMVANRVTSEREGQIVYSKLNSVVKQFLQGEVKYLGMVPQDRALEKAVRQQKPVSILTPDSKSARAFEALAAGLLHENIADISEKACQRKGISQLFADFLNYKK